MTPTNNQSPIERVKEQLRIKREGYLNDEFPELPAGLPDNTQRAYEKNKLDAEKYYVNGQASAFGILDNEVKELVEVLAGLLKMEIRRYSEEEYNTWIKANNILNKYKPEVKDGK